jgi:OOP family OmpA-OmpF porin
MTIRSVLAVGAMLLLTACSGMQLDRAENTPVGDGVSDFDKALHAKYMVLARNEYKEGDYADADFFADRAMAAAAGNSPDPQDVTERMMPDTQTGLVLAAAQNELDDLFAKGAREKVPSLSAAAQAAYECWLQEQEENYQPKDIQTCRDEFDGLIPAIQNAMAPPMKKKAMAAPAPKKMPKGALFKLYFALDSSTIDAAGREVIGKAVAHAANYNPPRVVVSGYTDTSGSEAYNQALSEKRARVVAAAMTLRGIPESQIKFRGYGERYLDVRTADGVVEAKNRRVEISVAP